MKREINFRGKRAETGEWIYGNLHVPNKLLRGVYICPDTTFGDMVPGLEDGDDFEEIRKLGCAIGRFHRVDVESVGQYTSLKDKNGKEIYEGDIVRTGTDKNMIISWSEQMASFVIEREGWAFKHYFGEAFASNECEVIGNIYDNPELLKEAGQ